MEGLRWNLLKNEWLRITRGVSFTDLTDHGELLEMREHPKRANQWMMLFEYQGYVWVVPCVKDRKGKFLKTLYPSRNYTKLFKRRTTP